MRTPWRVSFQQAAEITVTATHAQRGVAGDVLVLPFEVRSDSALPVPGAATFALPLALAGAACLSRRRD